MDLRVLRYFVAIAESRSISEAARVLNMSQPALTSRIRELEKELGVELLVRRPRGVDLTAAGRQLHLDGQRLLRDARAMVDRARNMPQGLTGSLAIGINILDAWAVGAIGTFRKQYPLVDLRLFPMTSGHQLEAMERTELDGGFMYSRPQNDEMLAGIPMRESRLVLAVARESALAANPPRRLADINGEDFIWIPRSSSATYYDQMNECFRQSGFVPKVVQEGADNAAMLGLVAAGIGCTLVPAVDGWRGPDGIALLPLEDENLNLMLEFVWQPERVSPVLSCMLDICRTIALSQAA